MELFFVKWPNLKDLKGKENTSISLRHFSSSFLHLTALKRKHRLTIVLCWKCINNCFLVLSVFTLPLLLDGHWCWEEGRGEKQTPTGTQIFGSACRAAPWQLLQMSRWLPEAASPLCLLPHTALGLHGWFVPWLPVKRSSVWPDRGPIPSHNSSTLWSWTTHKSQNFTIVGLN